MNKLNTQTQDPKSLNYHKKNSSEKDNSQN